MTKAYIPIRDFEAAFEPALELYDNKKAIKALMEEAHERRDNAPFRFASRLVRFYADEIIEFHKVLYEAGYKDRIQSMPMIIPTPKNPKEFTVFPNILLNNSKRKNENYLRELDVMANVSWVILHDPLIDFLNNVKADMADDKRKQKWATPNRAWRQIRRSESMPTARVLTRILGIKGEDHVIRDLAERIDGIRKPLELEWAETPQDYLTMYGEGPQSCMTEKGGGEPRSWIWMKDSYQHMPTSFFAYHPATRGVFVRKGNVVVCRAITYRLKDVNGKPRYVYGRVYSTNTEILNKFKSMLKDLGYGDSTCSTIQLKDLYGDSTFSIPGLEMPHARGHYGCPQPHQDNIPYYNVTFDKSTSTFIFSASAMADSIGASVGTRGYIDSRTCSAATCAYCKVRKSAKSMILSQVDDAAFCSEQHMYAAGYCVAYRGNGERTIMKQADSIPDAIDQSMFYTNRDAAIKNNAVPVIRSLDEITENIEDVPMSRHADIGILVGGDNTEKQMYYASLNHVKGGSKSFLDTLTAMGGVRVPMNKLPAAYFANRRPDACYVLDVGGAIDVKHINIKSFTSIQMDDLDVEGATAAA